MARLCTWVCCVRLAKQRAQKLHDGRAVGRQRHVGVVQLKSQQLQRKEVAGGWLGAHVGWARKSGARPTRSRMAHDEVDACLVRELLACPSSLSQSILRLHHPPALLHPTLSSQARWLSDAARAAGPSGSGPSATASSSASIPTERERSRSSMGYPAQCAAGRAHFRFEQAVRCIEASNCIWDSARVPEASGQCLQC